MTASAQNWTPPRTPDGQPDLQGIWTNYTGTPFEVPDKSDTPEFYAGDLDGTGRGTGPSAGHGERGGSPDDRRGKGFRRRRTSSHSPCLGNTNWLCP